MIAKLRQCEANRSVRFHAGLRTLCVGERFAPQPLPVDPVPLEKLLLHDPERSLKVGPWGDMLSAA